MNLQLSLLSIILFFLAHSISANTTEDKITVDDYVDACIKNEHNNMGPEICGCMGEQSKDLSYEELDFLYGITAQDHERVNKAQATLDSKRKMNVIHLNIMGPSKCTTQYLDEKKKKDEIHTPSSDNTSSESTTERNVTADSV